MGIKRTDNFWQSWTYWTWSRKSRREDYEWGAEFQHSSEFLSETKHDFTTELSKPKIVRVMRKLGRKLLNINGASRSLNTRFLRSVTRELVNYWITVIPVRIGRDIFIWTRRRGGILILHINFANSVDLLTRHVFYTIHLSLFVVCKPVTNGFSQFSYFFLNKHIHIHALVCVYIYIHTQPNSSQNDKYGSHRVR